jgi:putative transposase
MIPHARLVDIDILIYKAVLVDIEVTTIEESHTSTCRFLDEEPIQHHDHYLGKRVKRDVFVASDGRRIHADVNGSLTMLRRSAPQVMNQGAQAFAMRPQSIAFAEPTARPKQASPTPQDHGVMAVLVSLPFNKAS